MARHLFDELHKQALRREHLRLDKIRELLEGGLFDPSDLPAVARFADTLLAAEREFHEGLSRKRPGHRPPHAVCPSCRSANCLGRYYSIKPQPPLVSILQGLKLL